MELKFFAFLSLIFGLFGSVDCHSLDKNFSQPKNDGKIWALLMVGSFDDKVRMDGYSDEADVCHLYHFLRERGVAEENIIVMMPDDVAYDPRNPYPGKLFNEINGSDVYEGVKIDYNGSSVTIDNFLAVLQGQKDKVVGGNGRVLETTKDDNIFVYSAGHGGPGCLYMPKWQCLSAQSLNDALESMHKNERYKELVYYVEACRSGSMFVNMSSNIGVYAITAASPDDDTKACDCFTDFLPNACLSDYFTRNWLVNAEHSDLRKETLQEQFEYIHKHVSVSVVSQYGQHSIAEEHASNFQGDKKVKKSKLNNEFDSGTYCIPKKELPLRRLEERLKRAVGYEKIEALRQIQKFHEDKKYVEKHMREFAKKFASYSDEKIEDLISDPKQFTQVECHHEVVTTYQNECSNISKNQHGRDYISLLTNLCEQQIDVKVILENLKDHCENY